MYDKAFRSLREENSTKSKTKHIVYEKFLPQLYLFRTNPKIASTIFRLRSRNVECKKNRKSTSEDFLCRLCSTEEENQEHIINCPKIRLINDKLLDPSPIYNDVVITDDVLRICERVSKFGEEVRKLQSPTQSES